MAETPRWNIGREFGRQVVVLFLQSPLSSCVVSKSLYKLHQLAQQLLTTNIHTYAQMHANRYIPIDTRTRLSTHTTHTTHNTHAYSHTHMHIYTTHTTHAHAHAHTTHTYTHTQHTHTQHTRAHSRKPFPHYDKVQYNYYIIMMEIVSLG